ncbi:flagellar biosynthesis regulator FlaF [Salinarimonas sp. NSM]|uniref:flagellar biosynthesis regulator FlaF n=1 Tax=Salinarimonas sp. NSM TaxID=3458003 RepID=UPI004035A7F7
MNNAAQAYASTAKTATVDQRELEANLFMRAAAKLQAARERFSEPELREEALDYNKRIWSVFLPSIVDQSNPLPIELKGNLASLGVFVFRRMDEIYEKPAAERLDILVSINVDIAAGLRGQAAA